MICLCNNVSAEEVKISPDPIKLIKPQLNIIQEWREGTKSEVRSQVVPLKVSRWWGWRRNGTQTKLIKLMLVSTGCKIIVLHVIVFHQLFLCFTHFLDPPRQNIRDLCLWYHHIAALHMCACVCACNVLSQS